MGKIRNAIILAAGASYRFAPISYETHKGLLEVRGEILIERQIRQLLEMDITDIILVTGYMASKFDYLKSKYGVKLIYNSEYSTRNNNSSIWAVKDHISSSYICSADNYFCSNPFETEADGAYYAAEYAENETPEWCMEEDDKGYISKVSIGGENSWYMIGHSYWDEHFSEIFISILEDEYRLPATANKLWENIYIEHLDKLHMKIKKYEPHVIYEFDTLDELRRFDESYLTDTRSQIIKEVSAKLKLKESQITEVKGVQGIGAEAVGFQFACPTGTYKYIYSTGQLEKISN